MRARWKSIALTAVLAALASGAATWVSATWVMRERQPPSLHSVVHEQLNLSAEQDDGAERAGNGGIGQKQ